MNILSFNKGTDQVYRASDDFAVLWAEAESLGAVSLEPRPFSRGQYRAEVKFERASGSVCWARGEATEKNDALRLAIAEAKALKAA